MNEVIARSLLARARIDAGEFMGAGMEGHVFRIDDHLVAKVWHAASIDHLLDLQRFYTSLRAVDLPFRTPSIVEVIDLDGHPIAIEEALSGRPLREFMPKDSSIPDEVVFDAVVSVLAALRQRELDSATPNLTMLDTLIDPGLQSPTERLLALAEARIARYGDYLRARVPAFDALWETARSELRRRSSNSRFPIHGDICPPNILLDEDRQVTALLDWGFLTHAGDPAFETSITTCVIDMYGPNHREIEDILMERCVTAFGEDRERLLLYRILYAVITSNAYSEDGRDGHFEWCVAMMNRPDVRRAAGQS